MDFELGSVIGHRYFFVGKLTTTGLPVLASGGPLYRRFIWSYGVNKALCQSGHEAPNISCNCGIYSMKKSVDIRSKSISRHLYEKRDLSFEYSKGPITCVYGQIEAFGRTIIHEKGYRSEYAKVIKLSPVVYCSFCGLPVIGTSRIKHTPVDLMNPADGVRIWTITDPKTHTEYISVVLCPECSATARARQEGEHTVSICDYNIAHDYIPDGLKFCFMHGPYKEISLDEVSDWMKTEVLLYTK